MRKQYVFCLFVIAIYFVIFGGGELTAQEHADSTGVWAPEVTAPAGAAKDTMQSVSKILGIRKTIQKTGSFLPLNKLFLTGLLFLVALLIIRGVTRLLESMAERWIQFRLTIKGVIPIVRILGWTLVIYVIIAGIFAPPVETLIAATASAGIAIGFASQDILKNIFGGIMIILDRPFQVGDKIEVGNYYGEVMSIGLRTVRIVTPDDSLVSIPNSEIVSSSVSNANSGESNCQVVAEFYLPADINITRAKTIAYRTAAVSKYIYLNKPIAVIVKNEIHQGRSVLKMRLKAYVLDIRFEFPFMSEMTEIVMSELLSQKLISPDDLIFRGMMVGPSAAPRAEA